MIKHFILTLMLIGLASAKAQVNLDFESGNFNGWTGTVGNTNTAGQVTPVYTNTIWTQGVNAGIYTQSFHTIMSSGADMFGGFPVVAPGGNYSARLGNVGTSVNATGGPTSCTGVPVTYYPPKHPGYVGPTQPPFGGAESIEQTFMVTAANAIVQLQYAAVFNNGTHSGTSVVNPFFTAEVLDNLGNSVPCLTYTFVLNKTSLPPGAGSTGTIRPCWMGATSSSSVTVYMPWQQKIFDLTSRIGTNVTVRFSSGGCEEGGHFGYAYVDASAGPKALIQTGGSNCTGPVTLTGPNQYGSTYTWAGPAGGILAQSANSATVNTSGVYSLTVNGGACPITFTTMVSLTSPSITVVPSSQTVCAGALLSGVNFTTSPAGASITWTNTNTSIGLGTNGIGNIGAYTAPNVTSQQIGVVSATPSFSGCFGAVRTFTYVINPYPALNTSSSQTLTCANNTLTLTGSSSTSGTTFSWNPGGSSPTASATSVSAPGNYTVTASVGSCRTSSVISVASSTATPSLSISATNSGTLCAGSGTVILTASGADSYTWSPGAIVSNSISVSPSSTTSYSVTGMLAATGCTSQAIRAVIVSPTPTINVNTVASASPSICIGSSVGLSASGASSYTWSPATGLSGTNGQTVTAGPSSTQTYVVVGTSMAGCISSGTSSGTFVVSVNPLPTVSINASNSGSVCSGSSITLTGTGASTYTWNPGGAATTITVTPTANTSYTVTGTSAAGCIGQAVRVVTVSPTPTISVNTIASASPSICIGSSVGLNASGAFTYTWSPATGLSATTGQTVTANPTTTQTYVVVGTSTAGCVSTAASSATFVVRVNPLPVPVIAGSTTLTCAFPNITYSVSPAAGNTYTWTGSGVSGNTHAPTMNISQPGTLSVSITNTATGCTGITSISITQNTIVPTVTVNPGSFTTTCASSTVQLTATSSPSGVTYSWTPPSTGFVNNAGIQNPIASGSGVFTVQVTNPQNGCISAITALSTATVVADVNAPVVNLSPSNFTLTCLTTAQTVTVTSSMGGLTYTWSPAPASGVNSASPTFTAAGSYTAYVLNPSSGCSTNAIVNIASNTVSPQMASAASGSLSCSITTVQAVASTTASPVSYTWSGPGIVSGAGTPSITVDTGGPYTYTVTNTQSGCSSTGLVSVLQNTVVPTLTVSPGSYTTTCATPTVQLTANSSPGALSYSWTSPPTGSLSSYTTAATVANGSGIFTLTATNTQNNCTSAVTTVTIVPDANTPAVSASANSLTLTCAAMTQTVTLSGGTPNLTYSWTPAPSSGNGTPNPVFTAPGQYVGTITNTVNGCSVTTTISVTSNTVSPVISGINTSASSGSTITCTNASLSFTATATSGTNVSWNGPNGALSGNPVDISSPGNYTVTVTDPVNGCSTSSVIAISSNTLAPGITQASANADSLNCANPNANLSATSGNGNAGYSWTGPAGFSSNQQSPPAVSVPGTYTISVTDAVNGCSTSSVVSIAQGTNPVASFTATPTSGNAPLPVSFGNTSSGGFGSYNWSFGNGSGSNLVNPNTTYSSAGTYTVVLIGIASDAACNDTATAVITVIEDDLLIIPNVFTPNGDGSNDIFHITLKGYNDLYVEIYNRWGQVMSIMAGVKAAWDGKALNGELVPDGTYYYMLKAKKSDGASIEKQGFLTLIR